jgi:hypothetical protein
MAIPFSRSFSSGGLLAAELGLELVTPQVDELIHRVTDLMEVDVVDPASAALRIDSRIGSGSGPSGMLELRMSSSVTNSVACSK